MTIDKRTKRAVIIPAFLLVIPLLGQLFVDGWNWSASDFVFAYVVWTLAALAYVFLTKKFATPLQHWIVGIIVFGFLAAFWVIAATG